MTGESVFNWQDIFKSPTAQIVEIHPANGYLSDGILRYRCAGKCAALELKRYFSESSGSRTIELVLLLEGVTPEVMPGDKIVHSGETFEIAKVELCHSLSGEIIARRCTVK